MSPDAGPEARSQVCHKRIEQAGLPDRGPAVLARDEHQYPAHLDRLGGRGKGDHQRGAGPLTVPMLEAAFSRRDGTVLPSAGFLAGRSQPDEPPDRARVTSLVEGLLGSLAVDDLGALAPAWVEAAMAVALRGDAGAGREALAPVVADGARPISWAYLAAYYLAQMGDPSGWPALTTLLHGDNEHNRLMAARHLIAFVPHDGAVVDGRTVDVRAALVGRLADPEPYVHREVPGLLAEARVEGLGDILAAAAADEARPDVREAAEDVLARLGDG